MGTGSQDLQNGPGCGPPHGGAAPQNPRGGEYPSSGGGKQSWSALAERVGGGFPAPSFNRKSDSRAAGNGGEGEVRSIIAVLACQGVIDICTY